MKDSEIEKFVKDRDIMLEKFDPNELTAFVEKYKRHYNSEVYNLIMEYTEEQKYLVICAMISQATKISKATKKKAEKWMDQWRAVKGQENGSL